MKNVSEHVRLKIVVEAILSLCFVLSGVLFAQDLPHLVPQKHQATESKLTSMMGTVGPDGEKLTFVTDQRAWNVDNPEVLKGHEGHYVRVNGHASPAKGSIRITEVETPTVPESRKNDIR